MTDAFRELLATDQHQITSLLAGVACTSQSQPRPTRRRRAAVDQVDRNDQHKPSIMNPILSQAAAATTKTNKQQVRPLPTDKMICKRLALSTKERPPRRGSPAASTLTWPLVLVCLAALCLSAGARLGQADDSATRQQQQIDLRSTQPTLDRQLETPSSPSSGSGAGQGAPAAAGSSSAPVKPHTGGGGEPSKPHEQPRKPQKPVLSLASQKKAAALAAQRDYDKYQLKASSSSASNAPATPKVAASDQSSAGQSKPPGGQEKATDNNGQANGNNKQTPDGASSSSAGGHALEPAHKKIGQLPNTRQPPKVSAPFSLLRKFLPSFMTSTAAMAATASAAAASGADKQPHHNQHSRSSPATSSSLLSSLLSSSSAGHSSASASSAPTSDASSGSSALTGKIINLLSGASKKKGLPEGVSSAIPNHAPFFMRKAAVDRQAAGGGALALASGLLSNPLKLGLLFSAPLLPSLLLTPLAIAGLSPAMSAINNFFGDDDEPSSSSQSPLAALAGGSSSPLASILQATGASPFSSAAGADSSSAGSSSSPANSLALQAFQSFLGPTSTTERPLFNPGMFASAGVQSAAGALGSAFSAAQSGGSSSSSSSSGSSPSSAASANQRPSFFGSGGGLIQTAASMISPSFAAPPSSSGASSSGATNGNNDDDGPGLMQMASDVFEKVANFMGGDNKDSSSISQASGGSAAAASSPLSALAGLSSMSPFQLSSLFAATPLGAAVASPHAPGGPSSSGPVGHTNQRAGFLSTLRNVYELFSSSFLRRQEVGNENDCQQRLICELHQRAMNSKLFRRSLQSNLAELASLDKNLIEQLKYSSQALQARVDPDTKAMLSDFLKATNNFKSGREMINCSQMFPKCSRAQLLAAANAHLSDPVNGRAIGKFSQLMKKMKFKSNQQHQGQWKLRKPGKSAPVSAQPPQAMRTTPALAFMQPALDYLQVAPLAPAPGAAQMAPVDSLKLAQQIMMMSQMSQQPGSLGAPLGQYAPNGAVPQQQHQQQYRQPSSQQMSAGYQPSANTPQSTYPAANSYVSQYSPAPRQQTTYTDAIVPAGQYSPTESPYFMQPQQQPAFGGQQQSQSQPMSEGGQPSASQQGASYPVDQTMSQQQTGASSHSDNKNTMQQLLTPNGGNASRPAVAA